MPNIFCMPLFAGQQNVDIFAISPSLGAQSYVLVPNWLINWEQGRLLRVPKPLRCSYYSDPVCKKVLYLDLIWAIAMAETAAVTFFSFLVTARDGVPYSRGCSFGFEREERCIRAS